MTADLKPYPAMKDSGVEWLGEVPEHWEQRSLWTVSEPRVEKNPGGLQLLSVFLNRGVIRYEEGGGQVHAPSLDLTNYQVVHPGDFVLNNQQAWRGSVGVSRHHGIVSPAYIVLRLVGLNAAYANYLFQCPAMVNQFVTASKGVGDIQRQIYWPFLRFVQTLLPPLSEQAAIVRFLDHADRRIRRYIRAKQKLITLLEEQKQALIHQAVTGQIDVRTGRPYPAYKPSGVEWLGDVPEHWAVRRVKTLCSMRSGESITAESIETTGEYPVYGGNGLRGYASSYTHDGAFALIGRQGALCGNVHVARGKFWASEHAVVATLDRGHVLDWFGAILRVMNLNQYSIAAAQPGLSVERVLNLRVSVPPMQEQEGIANHIERDTADIDTALAPARRQIDLLQEYRTRLIADVVTGKLDVREAAESLLEEADERDPLDEGVPLESAEELAMESEVTV